MAWTAWTGLFESQRSPGLQRSKRKRFRLDQPGPAWTGLPQPSVRRGAAMQPHIRAPYLFRRRLRPGHRLASDARLREKSARGPLEAGSRQHTIDSCNPICNLCEPKDH